MNVTAGKYLAIIIVAPTEGATRRIESARVPYSNTGTSNVGQESHRAGCKNGENDAKQKHLHQTTAEKKCARQFLQSLSRGLCPTHAHCMSHDRAALQCRTLSHGKRCRALPAACTTGISDWGFCFLSRRQKNRVGKLILGHTTNQRLTFFLFVRISSIVCHLGSPSHCSHLSQGCP
jgi:hypothetical protein